MTKSDTQMMKGVAILLMLFLHLFNRIGNVELCTTFLSINDMPLINWLTRAASPVPFFLILGGYGLYTVYQKGDNHRFSRIFRLYSHYWLILTIFLLIGHALYPSRYPGNWMKILGNYSSFEITWNYEYWFLFPYVLLSITSPWQFRFLNRYKGWKILVTAFVINFCTSYFISRYGEAYLYNNALFSNFVLYFHLSFSFLTGAIAARDNWTEYLPMIKPTKWLWLLLLVLIILCCIIRVSIIGTPYSFCFIVLFLKVPKWNWVKNVLIELGKNSMDMWFIHTWFCCYLFKDFIYSFKYPLIIFSVLLIISYVCAKLISLLFVGIDHLRINMSH